VSVCPTLSFHEEPSRALPAWQIPNSPAKAGTSAALRLTPVCPTLVHHEGLSRAPGALVDDDRQTPRARRREGRGRRQPPHEAATPRDQPVSATRTQSDRSRPVAVWVLVAVSPATPARACRRYHSALDAAAISRGPQAAEVPVILRAATSFSFSFGGAGVRGLAGTAPDDVGLPEFGAPQGAPNGLGHEFYGLASSMSSSDRPARCRPTRVPRRAIETGKNWPREVYCTRRADEASRARRALRKS
jgi:hypothetical protein